MIRSRTSSLGAWRETDSVSCSFRFASSSIFGTRPQVLRLMCRMEMFMPSGLFTSSRKRITLSKLSSGSPMPISTMWEMGRPESTCVNSTSSSIS